MVSLGYVVDCELEYSCSHRIYGTRINRDDKHISKTRSRYKWSLRVIPVFR